MLGEVSYRTKSVANFEGIYAIKSTRRFPLAAPPQFASRPVFKISGIWLSIFNGSGDVLQELTPSALLELFLHYDIAPCVNGVLSFANSCKAMFLV